MLSLDLVYTFSVFQFFVSSPFLHTTPVLFHSFLSSVFCVLSFFIIDILFSFLSISLSQFIRLSYCIILMFYCIFFPFILFCFSNFSLFSLLFLYIATIFRSPFHFHPIDYVLFPSWHTIMCSVVSSSVLQSGYVVPDSFLL